MAKTSQIFNPDRLTRSQEVALIKIGIATIIQRALVNGARVMFPDAPAATRLRKPRTFSAAARRRMAAAQRKRHAAARAAAAAKTPRKGTTDGPR